MTSKVCPYEAPATFESLAMATKDKNGFNYKGEYFDIPLNPDTGNQLSMSVISFIKESTKYSIGGDAIAGYWPNLEKTEQGPMIKLWKSAKDRERGFNKRVKMRPGKALRHMFPFAVDTWIHETATKFEEIFSDGVFSVHVTETFDGFNNVYSLHVAPYKNPNTTSWRKSLATSCMRYDASHFGTECHPCAVYGSGDFALVYAIDAQGRLAARSILHKASNTYGPVYGVCEASIDAVRDKLKALDSASAGHSDWIGARLVRIESGNGFVGPYLDVEPRSLEDDGNHLVIKKYGSIDASDYNGTLGDNGVECHDCGCRTDPDDSLICDNGNHWCESCYFETFTTCEHCHETVRHEYTSQVNVVGYRGQHTVETWCDECVSDDAVECEDGELWRTEDCTLSACECWLSPNDIESGDWIICEDSEKYYYFRDVGQTTEGRTYREEYLKENGYTYSASSDLWSIPEEQNDDNATEEKAA